MATRIQKIMFQPISLIFRYLQNRLTIQVWLYDHADLRIEGRIIVHKPCFIMFIFPCVLL